MTPDRRDPKRKPVFLRQESWRYKRVKANWRKPKGKTSRMRRRISGWPKLVKVGYKAKLDSRGLHPSGAREVLVSRPHELEKVDPKTQVVRIAHAVGERKRIAIIEKAKELNLRVLNPGVKREEVPTEEFAVEEERGEAAKEEGVQVPEEQASAEPAPPEQGEAKQ